MRLDRKASRLRFVYPFAFDGTKFEARMATIAGTTATISGAETAVWEPDSFPAEDLVAHVAKYLNADEHNSRESASLLRIRDEVRDHVDGLGANVAWALKWSSREFRFSFEEIELATFRAGIGFLTLAVRPHSDDPHDWLDFVHAFRFTRGRRAPRLAAERSVGFDAATKTKLVEPFVPVWASPTWSTDGGRLANLISHLLMDPARTHDPDPWISEVFIPGQLLPFSAYMVDDAQPEEIVTLRFQMQRSLPARQPVAPPDSPAMPRHLLEYSAGQWFIFSLDGGAFLAANAPTSEFFRVTLPQHLESQYFLLFLLALHQRFALMTMSIAVCEAALLSGEQRFAAFQSIQRRLLEFTARGLFKQAMQRENHHVVYARWQEVFDLDRLYAEVRDEVSDLAVEARVAHEERMEQAAEAQRLRDEGRARRVQLLTLVIGFPAIVVTFMGINIRNVTDGRGITIGPVVLVVFASILLGVLVSVLIAAAHTRPSRRQDPSDRQL
jgi:hypothetical protein